MSESDFDQVKRLQQERNAAAAAKKGSRTFDPSSQRIDSKIKFGEAADTDLYDRNDSDRFAGYNQSIAAGDDDDEEMHDTDGTRRLVGQYTATTSQINEFARGEGVEEEDVLAGRGERSNRITDRETDSSEATLQPGADADPSRCLRRKPWCPSRRGPQLPRCHGRARCRAGGRARTEAY